MSPKFEEEWPEPSPLGMDLPPVASLTERMIPERLRSFALDAAERMEVMPDFVVVCLLTLLSGAIQRRARIQPRALDYMWQQILNLWGRLSRSFRPEETTGHSAISTLYLCNPGRLA